MTILGINDLPKLTVHGNPWLPSRITHKQNPIAPTPTGLNSSMDIWLPQTLARSINKKMQVLMPFAEIQEGPNTHSAREEVTPKEPDTLARLLQLSMKVAHEGNERARTAISSNDRCAKWTSQGVFWVVSYGTCKETSVEV